MSLKKSDGRVKSLALSGIVAALVMILFYIVRFSPLMDGFLYCVISLAIIVAIDQAGLRSAGLLYIVCVIASFVILVFPRNLAFICFFGPWPFLIYYCDHYISTARRAYFLKFIAATLIFIPCAFFAHTLVIHQLRSFNQIFESAHLSQLYLLALVIYYAAVFFFDYCIRVLLAHYLFRIRPNL